MTPIKKAGYLAHAMTAGYKRRVSNAMDMIADHPDYVVATSWGKDSLCLLHMAIAVHGAGVKAVHGRYGPQEELPDIPDVRDAFLSRFPCDYKEVPVWGDWDIYQKAGRFFLWPESKEERKILANWRLALTGALDDAYAGAAGKMLGLAAHESHGRMMNIRKRGAHYQTQTESMPKLLPLAHWKPEDVWAYMLTNDLPRLRIYDMAQDPERARSELAFAAIGGDAADAIRRHGAWAEWARAYPELWAQWLDAWPEMRDLM